MPKTNRDPLSSRSSHSPSNEKAETPLEAPVSNERRVREVLLSVAITAAGCAPIWLIQWQSDQLTEYWWYAWPVALAGLLATLYFALRKSAPTKEAIEIKKREEMERALEINKIQREEYDFFDNWYIRYPMACVFVIGGIWIYSDNPELWWAGLAMAGFATLMARELTLLFIALAVIAVLVYLVWQFFLAMPTAAAILIGAIIIAMAILLRRQ